MNIEHKKTALGDDSAIYQKRDNSFGKKNLGNLSKKEKLGYFRDYYLMKVIVAVVILIAVGALLNTTVFNRSECVLSVALINESQVTESDSLTDDLDAYLGELEKNDYVAVSNFGLDDYQMEMAFLTRTATSSIDLIICPEDYFEQACNQGMLADLSGFLPQETQDALSERILKGQEAETDDDGNIISYYEAKPYGIDISGSARLTQFGGVEEHPVLCVLLNVKNTENTLKAIEYFAEFNS